MSSTTPTILADDLPSCVTEIQSIGAVAQILETVAMITGLGFVAIAHVTDNSWTTCAVLDRLGLGLQVGDGLDVATTLCEEVRATASSIVIDHVRDSVRYRDHHTPRIYGFQSYFSITIFRPDGAYFGTLCGLDPEPAALSSPATVSTLELGEQLEVEQIHAAVQDALSSERATAELREQFIAVLGHDLRTPLGALQTGIDLLRLKYPEAGPSLVLQRMHRSVGRMNAMVDDVVDFTRGRMGGGIALNLRLEADIAAPLGQVIDELRGLHPERTIAASIQPGLSLACDVGRLAQLLSNLLKNAIVHGDGEQPIAVSAHKDERQFTLEVSNHGGALSPALIAQLFKPFWRAPSSGTHQGLGLGLYIVNEIAVSHGGAMAVDSRDGQVTFRFSLPHQSTAARLALPRRPAV